MLIRVTPKQRQEMCAEWDIISVARQTAIEEGKDISLTQVTAPWIIQHIINEKPNRVLDVGCGTGYLSNEIAKNVKYCHGIDASEKSIDIAKRKYCRSNLCFEVHAIKDFNPSMCFDACVANMVFMDDPEWIDSIKNIYDILPVGGKLFMIITHPCFWPKYWNYQHEPWFDYMDEVFIENAFSVSLTEPMGRSTHIHRPLSHYIQGLIETGLIIEEIEEPFPNGACPDGYEYAYPRFLYFGCRKKF